MIKHTIIQTALSFIAPFDGTKSKFEAWIESIENAAQMQHKYLVRTYYV